MSSFKWLLDENVDHGLRNALHQRTPEAVIWVIGSPGAPGLGTLDPDLLAWCETHEFSLVTNNRRSMPKYLWNHLGAGRHLPGIFVVRRDASMRIVADNLSLIWETAAPDEFRDRLTYIPLET